MSSIFDFLFQGSPPASVTESTKTIQGFPDWYQELMRANIGQSIAVASQPFQTFPGQQVAGPTSALTQSWQNVQNNQGIQNPSLNMASGALGEVAGGYNANEFQNYMNPYVTNVAENIATMGTRNLLENTLPGVNDTFTRAGQFGSSRHGDFTNRAIRDATGQIAMQQQEALMSGTQNAMNAYLSGQQAKLGAGQQLGALGQIYQNTAIKDAAALGDVGMQQQTQDQKNLDVAYKDWQNQTAYPQNMMTWLNTIIRGMPAPTQSSASTTYPAYSGMAPSPMYQAASVASGANQGLGGLVAPSVGTPQGGYYYG